MTRKMVVVSPLQSKGSCVTAAEPAKTDERNYFDLIGTRLSAGILL